MKKILPLLVVYLLFYSVPKLATAQSCCTEDGIKLGVALGSPIIGGEVRPEVRAGALAISLEKPLNKRLSLRYQLVGADARGQDWRPSSSTSSPLFRNYRNLFVDQNLQLMVNLCGPLSKARVYLVAGVRVLGYHTETDLLDEAGMLYSHESMYTPSSFQDKATVLDALDEIQDGHFETPLKGDPLAPGYDNDLRIRPSLSAGIGADFPLSNRLDLSLAYRLAWHGDQYLDGYETNRSGLQGQGADIVHLPTVGFTFRFGKNSNTACCVIKEEAPVALPEAASNSNTQQVRDNSVRLEALEKRAAQQENVAEALQQQEKAQDKRLDALEQQTSVISESIQRNASEGVQGVQGMEQSLFFDTGKSQIVATHYSALAQISAFARAYPNQQIEIRGYADAQGETAANEKLATTRAQAVADFLQKTFEVPPERISVIVVGDAESPEGVDGFYRRVSVSFE
jgi:outer membrane protein OmpA-like peptidoglycan-associated protein